MKWQSAIGIPTFVLLNLVSAQSSNSTDLALIKERRRSDLASSAEKPNQAAAWASSQSSQGTWSDVNYATGCLAQRANWPIQEHWNRVITLAAVYEGLVPSSSAQAGNQSLLDAASKGMDYWFSNDYTSDDCIGQGGLNNATCPCGTPGLWNTNWFDQIILIPQLCSTACLLLEDKLSASQIEGCTRIPLRAYTRKDDFINGLGYLTGANTINVMQNSISLGLYTNNISIVEDAYNRAMAVISFSDQPTEDGIHRDGSFLQHNGILYNGNYGMVLMNAFIQLEQEAKGTVYAANDTSRQAFSTVIKGSEWLLYTSNSSKHIHWDFNAIGRFIAFPTPDLQASADININITQLQNATADWTGDESLQAVVARLNMNGTATNANPGMLLGNKALYASDLMVHRRTGYIQTSKVLSNRTKNTECTNSANPYGYHMLDTLFTYVSGDEYQDIEASWDWNLLPGTTTLLDQPPLSCNHTGVVGKKAFVGGASDGWVGTQAVDFIDPYNQALSYRKVRHYFDDAVLVTISKVVVSNSSALVVTVLDQTRLSRLPIEVDGQVWTKGNGMTQAKTLWHGGNGFIAFDTPLDLNITASNRTGNWSAISTSTAGVSTTPIFNAVATVPRSGFSYAMYPSVNQSTLAFASQYPDVFPLSLGDDITAAAAPSRLSMVFWSGKQTASVPLSYLRPDADPTDTLTISTDSPCILLVTRQTEGIIKPKEIFLTVADPTQRLSSVSISLSISSNVSRRWQSRSTDVNVKVVLPQGGNAGDSAQTIVTLG